MTKPMKKRLLHKGMMLLALVVGTITVLSLDPPRAQAQICCSEAQIAYNEMVSKCSRGVYMGPVIVCNCVPHPISNEADCVQCANDWYYGRAGCGNGSSNSCDHGC